jgi:hypothetical protein
MGQDTAAAERSAHVLRGGQEALSTQAGPIVEVAPGYWKLRAIHELEVKLAAAEAERDELRDLFTRAASANERAEAERWRLAEALRAVDAAHAQAAGHLAEAIKARDMAIREMADRARESGSWQGIAEGKDIVIRGLEAERQRLRAALQSAITAMDMEGLSTADLRAALKEVEQ